MAAERRPRSRPAAPPIFSLREHPCGRCHLANDQRDAKLRRELRRLAEQAGGFGKLQEIVEAESRAKEPSVTRRPRGRPAVDDSMHLARMQELLRCGEAKSKHHAATIVVREAFSETSNPKSIIARLSRKFGEHPSKEVVPERPREYRIRIREPIAAGTRSSLPDLAFGVRAVAQQWEAQNAAVDAALRDSVAAAFPALDAATKFNADIQESVRQVLDSFDHDRVLRELARLYDPLQK